MGGIRKEYPYPSPVIADRIQKVMTENGCTDEGMAKMVGCDRKAIMHYRNCVTNPHVKFIRYMCETYHVDANWLLDIRTPYTTDEMKAWREGYRAGRGNADEKLPDVIKEIHDLVEKQGECVGGYTALEELKEWVFQYCQEHKIGNIPFSVLAHHIEFELSEIEAIRKGVGANG